MPKINSNPISSSDILVAGIINFLSIRTTHKFNWDIHMYVHRKKKLRWLLVWKQESSHKFHQNECQFPQNTKIFTILHQATNKVTNAHVKRIILYQRLDLEIKLPLLSFCRCNFKRRNRTFLTILKEVKKMLVIEQCTDHCSASYAVYIPKPKLLENIEQI